MFFQILVANNAPVGRSNRLNKRKIRLPSRLREAETGAPSPTRGEGKQALFIIPMVILRLAVTLRAKGLRLAMERDPFTVSGRDLL
ncbi:hypothetical protein AGMMS50256_33380 [Betaproteobacteria bacterium]|nr:hypothetical protein AGMMS50256_33380 [Betaproteobacteria bacterium]